MKRKLLLTVITAALCATGLSAEERLFDNTDGTALPELDCLIEPSEIVDIGSPVPGVIEKMLVDRSDLIKKGDVIVKLESRVEQATYALSRARSVLNTSIRLRSETAAFGALTQQRNQALMQTSAISRHNMDQLETEAKIAKLQVQQERDNKRIAGLDAVRSKAMLDRRTILSPVEGVVMERFKSVGEHVDDEPALRVARLDPLHIEVIVPVNYLGQIKPGMQAAVAPVAGDKTQRVATVERVDRVADAASSTYGVRLILPNPDYQVTAGLRCKINFLPVEKTAPLPGNARVSSVEENVTKQESQPEIKTAELQIQPAAEKRHAGGFVKVSSVSPQACYRIGPVKSEAAAQTLSRQLATNTSQLKLRHEKLLKTKDYVVMTSSAPGKNERAALLQRLDAAGVSDRFVFATGRYRDRVSLGTFYYEASAAKRQQQMASLGFDTKIVKRRKHATQYWLDAQLPSGKSAGDQLETARKKYAPSAPLEQVACGKSG